MKKLVFIFMLCTPLVLISQTITAYKGGILINPASKAPVENSIILVQEDKIIAAGSSEDIEIPEGAAVVDITRKYVIPGLIDAHIHFFQSAGLYTRPDAIDLRHRRSYDEEIRLIRENMDDLFRRYISCGITSVVDVGGPYWNYEVRKESQEAECAPRVFLTGPLLTSWMPDAHKIEESAFTLVNSIEDAKREVKKQLSYDPDFIKIWYIVGRGSTADEFFPIAKAICDESHKAGKPVYIHATELETAKQAVRAGCDVLVHLIKSEYVDDEFLELVKKNNVVICPTMWVFQSYAETFKKQLSLMPVEHLMANPYVIGTLFDMFQLDTFELGVRQKSLLEDPRPVETGKELLKNMKAVQEYGITIAAGTDAGNIGVVHGPSLFHEFAMMKKAGLSEREILLDATLGGAKMLKKEKDLGSVEKGKFADFVILNSDPIADIQNCADIKYVVKGGKQFKSGEIIERTPSDLAQIQLNAYNNRNIEAFLAVYHEDVEIFEFPSKFLYKGKDKMRERYTEYFEKNPNLHCQLIGRLQTGNFVMDQEYVFGLTDREPIKAVAVYEIQDGLIRKVWFVR